MELLSGIYSRRSVRSFTPEPVSREQMREIILAGSWAPSGLNNQPWRFATITDKGLLRKLAALSRYRHIIEGAPLAIAVFCDSTAMYHEVKDHQAVGACIENMLLAAHAQGLGGVWLGEILKNAAAVNELLELKEEMALMAVLAIGHPSGKSEQSKRKNIDELILRDL
jgi:nitroreductase